MANPTGDVALTAYTLVDIQRLADAIRRARDTNRPFYMLTGAGCSLSAGIPLAPKLVDEIHEKYGVEIAHHLNEDQRYNYGACMGCLASHERRDLLNYHLHNAQVNWAHIAIASMMLAKFVTRVLTFNLDSVLAQACGLVGLYPAIYDFAAAPSDVTDHIAVPAIIHLHGQGFAHKMLNSEEETTQHAENLRPLIRNSFNEALFLVIGYSGLADAVFPIIKESYQGAERLYWAGYEEDPEKHVRFLLEKGGSTAEFLGKADADPFLIELARALECWPPQLFNDPYGHLLDELEPVTAFPVKGGDEPDLLSKLRTTLQTAQKEHAADTSGDLEVLFMKGDWGKLLELGNPENDDEKDLIGWAYIMQGNELLDRAKLKDDEAFYAESFEKCAKALEVKPHMHEAYNNWGAALADLAKLKDDETLYAESFEKIAEAIEIKPDKHEAYNNWGAALSDLAKLKDDEALYAESFEKLAKAIEVKPDTHEAYYNWGVALLDLAKLKKDAALYADSFEKFAKALEIKPDKHEAYNGWGNALLELAKLKDDEARYAESFEKYAKALEIKPDYHEAYFGWGVAVLDLAKLKGDEERYAEGFEKYAKVIKIKPDMHEAYNNWGIALSGLAKLKDDETLYAESFEKFAEAIEIKPDKHEAYSNWGAALLDLAKLKDDEALYAEGFEKFAKAIEIKPDKHEAYSNWGVALSELAELKGDEPLYVEGFEKFSKAIEISPDNHVAYNNWGSAFSGLAKLKDDEPLYAEGFEKYAKAIEIKPDYYEAYSNWGIALLNLAQMKDDKSSVLDAREKLEQAEALNADNVYNLACFFARTGDSDNCRRKLLHCKEKGTLLSKAHMQADTDLDSVRELDWFQSLIADLP